MKKIVMIAAAVWLVAACSPKEDFVAPSAPQARVFKATMESTRTFLDGKNVCWETDLDKISVFDKSDENLQYVYSGEDGATQGIFTTSATPSGGNELPYVYASYPYDSYNEASDDGTMLVWFSPRMQYRKNSFGACPMVAVSEDENLKFYNLCGFIAIPVYGDLAENIAEIAVYGNGGEIISGDMVVSAAIGTEPVSQLGLTDYAYNYVYYNFEDDPFTVGTTASKATVFYFTLPPMTFENGISIEFVGEKGSTYTYSSSNPLTIKRSVCTQAGAVEVVFPEIVEDPVTKAYIEENLAGSYIFNITGYDGTVYETEVSISYNLTANGNVHLEGEFIDMALDVEATFDPETGTLSIPGFSAAGTVYYGYFTGYLAWVVDGYVQSSIPIEFSLTAPHTLSLVPVLNGEIWILFYYEEQWQGWDSCSPFNSITYQGPLSAPRPKAKAEKLSKGDDKEFVIDRAPKAEATAPVSLRKAVR